jgi:hypothetical protein
MLYVYGAHCKARNFNIVVQYNHKLTAWNKDLLKLRNSPVLMETQCSLLSSQELLAGFLSQMNTRHICTPFLWDTF